MKRTERHHLKEDEMATGVTGSSSSIRPTSARSRSSPGRSSSPPSSSAGSRSSAPKPGASAAGPSARSWTWPPRSPRSPRSWPSSRSWPPRGGPRAWPTWSWPSTGPRRAIGPRPNPIWASIPAGPKDLLYYQAEDLKAQVALGRKDYDKAIAIYTKIGDEKPKAYPLDAARFRLAECHELKGDTATALELYKKLQDGVPPVLFRLRGLPQAQQARGPEVGADVAILTGRDIISL